MRKLLLVTLLCSSAVLMRADFTYTETTQMTGGSLAAMMQSLGPLAGRAREPIVSTHIVKGNRMATISRDTVSITDLDKETITTIDNGKKQYTVMTFAEMKQRMQEGMQRMQGRQKGKDGEDVQANFKVSAKATGQTKTVQGLTAKEMVITMTMEMADAKSGQAGTMDFVTDSWVAPLPGYDEVREFHKRMAVKMGAMFGSGMQQIAQMNAGQANMGKGMEEIAKEMQKLDGIPVESTVKMGGAGNRNAAAPPPPPPSSNAGTCSADAPSQQPQKSSQTPAGALAGALGGRLGGFGGLGRRPKEDQPAPAQTQSQSGCTPAPAAGGAAASGALMEMTTTLTSFSPASADNTKFEIPAGYKQVERRGR
jgi:hypothetical protein